MALAEFIASDGTAPVTTDPNCIANCDDSAETACKTAATTAIASNDLLAMGKISALPGCD